MNDNHYVRVTDACNRPVRGLWMRNGLYYAQMRVVGKEHATLIPLKQRDGQTPAKDLAEALDARRRLADQREDGNQPTPQRTPLWNDYVQHYLDRMKQLQQKSESTLKTESYLLRSWQFGNPQIHQITARIILDAMTARKRRSSHMNRKGSRPGKPVSAKTMNEELIALRNVLKFAALEGWIRKDNLPTEGIKGTKRKAGKKEFLSVESIEAICTEAMRLELPDAPKSRLLREIIRQYQDQGKVDWKQAFTDHPEWMEQLGVKANNKKALACLYQRAWFLMHGCKTGLDVPVPVYENGQAFADWVRFMAWSGARNAAARQIRWEDIDWDNRQIHLHTKGDQWVIVPFIAKMEGHLKDMLARAPKGQNGKPASPFLFPSSKREGQARRTFGKMVCTIRQQIGIHFTAHDLRHHFASQAVMAGIDFMSIAAMLGHKDGGILVANLYGHLAAGHVQQAVKKLDAFLAPKEPAKEDRLAKLEAMMQQMLAMQGAGGAAPGDSPSHRP